MLPVFVDVRAVQRRPFLQHLQHVGDFSIMTVRNLVLEIRLLGTETSKGRVIIS